MSDSREDLKAFLDAELPPSRMAEIDAALHADPALAAEAEMLHSLSLALKARNDSIQAVGLEQTLAKLERRRRRRIWFQPRALALYGALAGCIAVVAFLSFPRPEPFGVPRAMLASRQFDTAAAAKAPMDLERADMPAKPEADAQSIHSKAAARLSDSAPEDYASVIEVESLSQAKLQIEAALKQHKGRLVGSMPWASRDGRKGLLVQWSAPADSQEALTKQVRLALSEPASVSSAAPPVELKSELAASQRSKFTDRRRSVPSGNAKLVEGLKAPHVPQGINGYVPPQIPVRPLQFILVEKRR